MNENRSTTENCTITCNADSTLKNGACVKLTLPELPEGGGKDEFTASCVGTYKQYIQSKTTMSCTAKNDSASVPVSSLGCYSSPVGHALIFGSIADCISNK